MNEVNNSTRRHAAKARRDQAKQYHQPWLMQAATSLPMAPNYLIMQTIRAKNVAPSIRAAEMIMAV